MADEPCPRCEYSDTNHSGTETIRHGQIIEVDHFTCPSCNLEFQRRY